MPRCYQLIGVPGSGKSTWVSNQDWSRDCVVISTDTLVERFAKRIGKTYNEIFADVMPRCVRLMMRQVIKAREEGKDIIWDQTSTSMVSRIRKFNALPDYDHIAVVFPTPDKAELARRLSTRPDKHIPRHVVESMIHNFEIPTKEEGFMEIWLT